VLALAAVALATSQVAAVPTPQNCAIAWNAAPPVTARQFALNHARNAIVGGGEGFTMRWGPGGSSSVRSGPQCTIVVYSKRSAKTFVGRWAAARVSRWRAISGSGNAPDIHERNAILTKTGRLYLLR
jgi:hypothetical protein